MAAPVLLAGSIRPHSPGPPRAPAWALTLGDLEKAVGGVAEVEGMKGAWFKDPGGNIISIGQPT